MLHGNVRAVIFDAVGTLIHPTPSVATVYTEFAARHGAVIAPDTIRTRFPAAFRKQEAIDREADWVTSEVREKQRWRQIVTETLHEVRDAEACFRELYEHYAHPESWVVADDAPAVLETLHERGYLIGLASNLDKRLQKVIDGFPALARLLETVIISSVVGYRKPSAHFFDVVRERLGNPPPHTIAFVGDDFDNDFIGASTAGFHAILLDETLRYPEVTNRITRLKELHGTRSVPNT